MIKDKTIKTIIPFMIVFMTTFFLADADLFEVFGKRIDQVKGNVRLLWLLNTADVIQGVSSGIIAVVFFIAWRRNKDKGFWFTELTWQISGAFFCWALLSVAKVAGTLALYTWIHGLLKLFIAIFVMYMANTVVAARSQLFNPEMPEEMERKARKFDELLKALRKHDG